MFYKNHLWSDFFCPQISTDFIKARKSTAFFSTEFFVHRLAQIITDFLISKDIVIITDYYHQSSIIFPLRPRALGASTLAHRASNNRNPVALNNCPVRQPRPRRLDNRNSIA